MTKSRALSSGQDHQVGLAAVAVAGPDFAQNPPRHLAQGLPLGVHVDGGDIDAGLVIQDLVDAAVDAVGPGQTLVVGMEDQDLGRPGLLRVQGCRQQTEQSQDTEPL
jgi:hypothetical protein